jgi:hypothetical protein
VFLSTCLCVVLSCDDSATGKRANLMFAEDDSLCMRQNEGFVGCVRVMNLSTSVSISV